MSEDPTQWFRPRPARDGAGSADPRPGDAPPGASGPGGTPAEPDATQALDRDGLDDLFGDQRDYSDQSDWLPAGSESRSEAPTAVLGASSGADPIAWLADRPAPPFPADATSAAGATTVAVSTEGDESPGSRRTLIILATVGALLVVGIIIGLVVLFTSGTAAPKSASTRPSESASAGRSPSPSTSSSTGPSASPSATPSPTVTPPTPAATITSFTASPSAPRCTAETGTADVSFSWSTSNAAKVALSLDGGAVINDQLSASGTLSNVPYDCTKASQGYTLTATNAKGIQTSKPITLVRPAIQPPPSPSPSATPAASPGTGG